MKNKMKTKYWNGWCLPLERVLTKTMVYFHSSSLQTCVLLLGNTGMLPSGNTKAISEKFPWFIIYSISVLVSTCLSVICFTLHFSLSLWAMLIPKTWSQVLYEGMLKEYPQTRSLAWSTKRSIKINKCE